MPNIVNVFATNDLPESLSKVKIIPACFKSFSYSPLVVIDLAVRVLVCSNLIESYPMILIITLVSFSLPLASNDSTLCQREPLITFATFVYLLTIFCLELDSAKTITLPVLPTVAYGKFELYYHRAYSTVCV